MAVTKSACSFPPLVSLLASLGISNFGDSNPENLRALKGQGLKTALLKAPPSAFVNEVDAWGSAFTSHAECGDGEAGLVIMLELGDGKDGVLPSELPEYIAALQSTSHRDILGLASCFACLRGRLPDRAAIDVFLDSCAVLGRMTGRDDVLASVGGTVMLRYMDPALAQGITQIRVGEGLLLGWDSSLPGPLPGLRMDTAVFSCEVIEVRDKPLPSSGLGGRNAFGKEPLIESSLRRRAVLDAGALAAPASGLRPLEGGLVIEGQTFDFLVLGMEKGARDLRPGDRVEFAPDYAALSQACMNPFVEKTLT